MGQLAELTPFLPLCGAMATTMINKVENNLSNILKKLCQQLTVFRYVCGMWVCVFRCVYGRCGVCVFRCGVCVYSV